MLIIEELAHLKLGRNTFCTDMQHVVMQTFTAKADWKVTTLTSIWQADILNYTCAQRMRTSAMANALYRHIKESENPSLNLLIYPATLNLMDSSLGHVEGCLNTIS